VEILRKRPTVFGDTLHARASPPPQASPESPEIVIESLIQRGKGMIPRAAPPGRREGGNDHAGDKKGAELSKNKELSRAGFYHRMEMRPARWYWYDDFPIN
jgi:hypothetical protein